MKFRKRPGVKFVMTTCACLLAITQVGADLFPVRAATTSPASDLAGALARMREVPTGARLWASADRCGCVEFNAVGALLSPSGAHGERGALRQPLYAETRIRTSDSSFSARLRISRLAFRDGVAPLTLYHELRHVLLGHAEWRASRSRRAAPGVDYGRSHARIDTYSDPSVRSFIAQVPEVRQILVSRRLLNGRVFGGQAPPGEQQSPPPVPPAGGSGPL